MKEFVGRTWKRNGRKREKETIRKKERKEEKGGRKKEREEQRKTKKDENVNLKGLWITKETLSDK